jgi:SAM-dependent methyltransferase
VDFAPAAPNVRPHDARDGIPYRDGIFDVVYHSHLLEHLSKRDGSRFLRECFRVLRPGGVIRVAVPDLEQIARLYLEALENASLGIPGWRENYEWMVLEMYDQAVRECTGGSWMEYCRRDAIPNWNFVYRRAGAEAEAARESSRAEPTVDPSALQRFCNRWNYIMGNVGKVSRNKLARIVLSNEDLQALEIGRFRRTGEVHQWMYDRYSLAGLLCGAGFIKTQVCSATESQISNWAQYCLDSEPDGTIYKPDSIYMEAIRP